MHMSAGRSNFFTTTSNNTIHYTQEGDPSGRTVVLLHGLGGSVETFTPLLSSLQSDRYNFIAVDFPGFGKTTLGTSRLTVARHVADLDDLMAHLQGSHPAETKTSVKPIIIIGHSLGSIVALHYATRRPQNVAGLGLLGVGRSASHIEAARQRMNGLAAKVRADGIEAAATLATTTNFAVREDASSAAKEVHKAVAASDPEGYAQTCEMMVSPDHVDPDYILITCPVVFVSGEGDLISPPQRAKELSVLLGGTSEVFLVRGGHQPILSDLEGTREATCRLFHLIERTG